MIIRLIELFKFLLPVNMVSIMLLGYAQLSFAEDAGIGIIDHPYVDAFEQELEFNYFYLNNDNDDEFSNNYKFVYGRSVSSSSFLELNLLAEKSSNNGFDFNAYEIEYKHQLTEQGEYWLDAGLELDYEREFLTNDNEIGMTALLEKQIAKSSLTTNLNIAYAWGDQSSDEVEYMVSTQWRYRYRYFFEPAIELFIGQDTRAIGPQISGQIKIDKTSKLHWESALIMGLNNQTPDTTLKFILEYEFY